MTDDERAKVKRLIDMLIFMQGAVVGDMSPAERATGEYRHLATAFAASDAIIVELGFDDPNTRSVFGVGVEGEGGT